MRTMYTKPIAEACKVDETEARIIEQVIRDNWHPTLDHLTQGQLTRRAKQAHKLLQEDPELRKLILEEHPLIGYSRK